MLVSLHVKNFAIIQEVEVYFKNHLNIMTGETGAGKSIIIGSINAALGAKLPKDIIRSGAEYALVELVFETEDQSVFELMEELDLPKEGNQIMITRKIMPGRSICKINGENVTTSTMSSIASLLIDIHGQHEHQSLLHKSKHLEIVDRFAKEQIGSLKVEVENIYQQYIKLKQEYENSMMDEEKRLREISFLEYEMNEIESAKLKAGEDEELAIQYKKLFHTNAIAEGLQQSHSLMGYDSEGAGESISRALRYIQKIVDYDDDIKNFLNQINEIETLVNDFNRDVSQYLSGIDNNEEALDEVTKRLDQMNHLKQKYGNTIEDILAHGKQCEDKLLRYQDYDQYRDKLKKQLEDIEELLKNKSQELSKIRKEESKVLVKKIKEALLALNFLDVQFDMVFTQLNHYTSNGFDDGEFIISTNPGESMKPLSKVASGGELSRVMLGIKSVLADKDEIETLIFDEIDVGISGRTAQKVSEQLAAIARHHQIICITHLAQIAAMADNHYIIEKRTDGSKTETSINELKESEQVEELARILGGAMITERVLESAKEMKELATASKNYKM